MDWGEDHLLPRMPDGRGHNPNRLAPAGIIFKISPDGKDWEIVSSGYRNIFDGGFNSDEELFTYDADMEYDFNTPWYRPTRICHVTSGSMGRNGTGNDLSFIRTLCLFIEYWTRLANRDYPLGMARNSSKISKSDVYFWIGVEENLRRTFETPTEAYSGVKETFITGSPLPVTDAIIHPKDGSMYFAIGGRKSSVWALPSQLYRQ